METEVDTEEVVSIVTPDSHSGSSSSELVFSDDSPESPKSPKSFALAALSALSTSFSPFAQPVFRTSSHSSLSSPPSAPSTFSGLQSVSASPSLPSLSERQAYHSSAAGSTAGSSTTFSTPSHEVQKLTHLSTLSQLICHLAQQSTHRKQDYATMLQFLRLISSCDPSVAARQGITVWTVEAAELIPPGVGSWMLVKGSERAVMKIGIGPNPGLKKYYWRDGSSKRFYKRETEGGVQDMSLVYIIQKASSASKRCVSIPGSDLWLILYLRATPPGSQGTLPARTSPGHPFLTQSQESITEILLSLQKTSGSKNPVQKRSPPENNDGIRPFKVARRPTGDKLRTPESDSPGSLNPFGSSSSSDSSPGSPPLNRSSTSNHADRIVQSLVDAYNSQDILGVMGAFDDHVEIYINGGEKIVGRDAVRARYQQIFRTHANRSTILHRSVLGRRVVDHEWIGGETEHAEVIAIYDIDNDAINRVWIFPYLGGNEE